MKMEDKGIDDALIQVLTHHYKALQVAGCDPALLTAYAGMLRFLRSRGIKDPSLKVRQARRSLHLTIDPAVQEQIRTGTLDYLDKLVRNTESSRSLLEWIAVNRFSVPKGSLRSFSDRTMLVNKLCTLIANERTHGTIASVAQSDGG